jgi:nucleotide-binding universal stress UspA family protein
MEMLMNKILLPIDFPNTPLGVVHQAAFLARHFHSEIILLHVVTPFSFPAGVLESGDELTLRDVHAHIVQQAQKDLDQALRSELEGITVKQVLLKGDPSREIVQTARDEKASLIAMSRHSHGGFYRFLIGSVAAKVLHDSVCPIWTDTYGKEEQGREFAIRSLLCAVDMTPHSRKTLSLDAQMATEFDARLTLVHVTDGMENYGPGGSYVDPTWKAKIVGFAAEEISKLQQDVGTKADVIITSGNPPEALNRAAVQTKADVLMIGHIPSGGHLGANGSGYSIIRDSQVPVLSV